MMTGRDVGGDVPSAMTAICAELPSGVEGFSSAEWSEARKVLYAQKPGLGFFGLYASSNDDLSLMSPPLGVSTTFMHVSISKAWAIAFST